MNFQTGIETDNYALSWENDAVNSGPLTSLFSGSVKGHGSPDVFQNWVPACLLFRCISTMVLTLFVSKTSDDCMQNKVSTTLISYFTPFHTSFDYLPCPNHEWSIKLLNLISTLIACATPTSELGTPTQDKKPSFILLVPSDEWNVYLLCPDDKTTYPEKKRPFII